MTDMVERVARAIAECEVDLVKDGYPPVARAAIEAMMEPTPDMLKAGLTADHAMYECAEPETVYQAMLRAALEGK